MGCGLSKQHENENPLDISKHQLPSIPTEDLPKETTQAAADEPAPVQSGGNQGETIMSE